MQYGLLADILRIAAMGNMGATMSVGPGPKADFGASRGERPESAQTYIRLQAVEVGGRQSLLVREDRVGQVRADVRKHLKLKISLRRRKAALMNPVRSLICVSASTPDISCDREDLDRFSDALEL